MDHDRRRYVVLVFAFLAQFLSIAGAQADPVWNPPITTGADAAGNFEYSVTITGGAPNGTTITNLEVNGLKNVANVDSSFNITPPAEFFLPAGAALEFTISGNLADPTKAGSVQRTLGFTGDPEFIEVDKILPPVFIPTLNEWGILTLGLLLLASGVALLEMRRRRGAEA